MDFQITKDIQSSTYQDALTIRSTVFIEEQGVSKEIEIDENEDRSFHFVGYLNERPIITARILESEAGIFTMQRVATLKDYRNKGYGALILKEIENYLRQQTEHPLVILDAQDTAIKFYESNDYKIDGEGYVKAGIPHHAMYKQF